MKREMKSREIFPVEQRRISALWISRGDIALTAAEQEIEKFESALVIKEKEIKELKRIIFTLEQEKKALLDDIDTSRRIQDSDTDQD